MKLYSILIGGYDRINVRYILILTALFSFKLLCFLACALFNRKALWIGGKKKLKVSNT
jgi:hypothetical protein